MGLDMYLYKKVYVKNWDHMRPEERTETTVLLAGEPHPEVDSKKVAYITQQLAYWRKANQIHNWFVNHVQGGVDDCREYEVSLKSLQELVATCREVLDHPEKAAELLPTTSGFFFGSTEYDEYYWQDLKDTVELLEDEIDRAEGRSGYLAWIDYEYRSSW